MRRSTGWAYAAWTRRNKAAQEKTVFTEYVELTKHQDRENKARIGQLNKQIDKLSQELDEREKLARVHAAALGAARG